MFTGDGLALSRIGVDATVNAAEPSPAPEQHFSESVRASADRAKTAALFENTKLALWGNLTNALLLSIALRQVAQARELGWWLGCGCVVLLARLWLWRSYSDAPRQRSERGWSFLFTLGTTAMGLWWCAAAPLFILGSGSDLLLVYAVLSSGMSAGAAATVSSYFPAFLGYLIPCAAGVSYCLFRSEREGRWVLVAAMLIFCVYLFGLSFNVRSVVLRALELRYQKSHLAHRLQQANLALERSHSELERRVDERSRNLAVETQGRLEAERQLADAQRLESVGRLTEGIAHDFNNNLAIIMNCLSLLDDGIGNAQELKACARRAARSASGLTSNLLRFSRQAPQCLEVHDLSLVLPLMASSVLKQSIPARIELLLELHEEALLVEVDSVQLENAILNLVLNARDAMPEGGQVTLRAERRGDRCCIEVIDQGSGIPREQLDQIFEPYFTTKGEKGTGLGLPMVQAFAQQAQGELRVNSGPRGTRVAIELPRYRGGQPAVTRAKSRPFLPAMGDGQKLLVVEDCQALLDTTLEMLEHLGFSPRGAKSAVQALDILEDERFDLVLSDYRMPGELDGLDLVHEIERCWPGTPVLLLTGQEISEGSALSRMVLRKPYDRRSLAEAIAQALDHHEEPAIDSSAYLDSTGSPTSRT